MKKLFIAIGLGALLAGCASHNNGMGGTSDEGNSNSGYYGNQGNGYNNQYSTGEEYNNQATHGTGTDTATNMNSDGTVP